MRGTGGGELQNWEKRRCPGDGILEDFLTIQAWKGGGESPNIFCVKGKKKKGKKGKGVSAAPSKWFGG